MAAALCKECGQRPKALPRQRCVTCQLRHEPIGDQVEAAHQRLAMIPPELRVKRSAKVMRNAPAGRAWCAGCQSWRDAVDFRKGATTCRACASDRQHGAMVAKVYGLTSSDYDTLLKLQGGRCAICRARPKSKRLAVDHDHKTGAVRGLLCSRCNHDLMGSAWDSRAMATALWHYMATPPASGAWLPPERAPQLVPDVGAQGPPEASGIDMGLVAKHGKSARQRPSEAPAGPVFVDVLPAGWRDMPVETLNATARVLLNRLRVLDPPPF